MGVMGLYEGLQRAVERVFFGGNRTKVSEAVSYIAVNLFVVLVLFYVVLNTIVYNWTGALYAHGFHLNTALDNAIPFVPEWAIFYLYLFYPLSALTMAYFVLIDFRRCAPLAMSLVLINLAADIVYAVFPVTTDIYRQALLAHPMTGNPFATAMYAHYASDPSFDCFPSLHAAVAVICFYTWFRYARARRGWLTAAIAAFMFVIATGVVLSTLFVKQHYIADEIAGILLAWGIGRWMFDTFWRREPGHRSIQP